MNNVIIGSGLLANSFSMSISKNCIFFCSGVSNSNETDPKEFNREIQTLRSSIDKKHCFVYFSSIQAPYLKSSYYNHKLRMESIVQSEAGSYLILRLPQVAGITLNNTLLPMFIKNIYHEKHFEIYKDAPRSLIDVEHVVDIFDKIYSRGCSNKILNFYPGYSFQPIDLVEEISRFLGLKPKYNILEKYISHDYPSSDIQEEFNSYFTNQQVYLKEVVEKYTPKIINLINQNYK